MSRFLIPDVPALNSTNRNVIDKAAVQAFKERKRALEARPAVDPLATTLDPSTHRLPGMKEQNLTLTEYATMHRQIDQAIMRRLTHDDRPEMKLLHFAAQTYLSIGLNSDYGGDMTAAMIQAIHDLNSMYVAGVQAAAKRLLGRLFEHANDLVEQAQAEAQTHLQQQLAEQAKAHRLELAAQAEAHRLTLENLTTTHQQAVKELTVANTQLTDAQIELRNALAERQQQVQHLERQLQARPLTGADPREVQVLRERVIVLERERNQATPATPKPAPTPLSLPQEQQLTVSTLEHAFALKLWLDAQGFASVREHLTLIFCSVKSSTLTAARFAAEVPNPRLYARQALASKTRPSARSA